MAPYIVITTQFGVYKCHDYHMKNGRVYFNSRAVNASNVESIVLKDGSKAYSNDKITPYNARKLTSKARRSEAAAKNPLKTPSKGASKKKSTLPDVIEI